MTVWSSRHFTLKYVNRSVHLILGAFHYIKKNALRWKWSCTLLNLCRVGLYISPLYLIITTVPYLTHTWVAETKLSGEATAWNDSVQPLVFTPLQKSPWLLHNTSSPPLSWSCFTALLERDFHTLALFLKHSQLPGCLFQSCLCGLL